MNREHAERVYFEQLKRAVSIEAVLAKYGIELKGRGRTLKGPCPIHKGSNPTQFVVDADKGLWHCFGDCKRGGSIIELVAAMENVEARNAALIIARWFAISSGTPGNQHSTQRRIRMSGERPSHKAFVVEGDGDSAFWHRCGSAWPHKDGKGLNVQIATGLAVSGRLVLREFTDEDVKEEEQQKSSRRKK
jgi:CHC2-type zinc finger protein